MAKEGLWMIVMDSNCAIRLKLGKLGSIPPLNCDVLKVWAGMKYEPGDLFMWETLYFVLINPVLILSTVSVLRGNQGLNSLTVYPIMS